LNVHFNYNTAKRIKGFAETHDRFWDDIASVVTDFGINLILADMNMSFLLVVENLRRRNIECDLGAWYAWQLASTTTVRLDSCGIWLIGGCKKVSLQLTKDHLLGRAAQGGQARGSADPAPDATAQGDTVVVTARALQEFSGGQGYPCTSYLPHDSVQRMRCIDSTFTQTKDLKDNSWIAPVPPWKQKLVNVAKFDPDDLLFKAGAHMPLLGFLGDLKASSTMRSSRREAKNRDRQQRAQAARREHTDRHGKGVDKGNDKGKGKGKCKWKGKGNDKGKGKGDDDRGDGISLAEESRSGAAPWPSSQGRYPLPETTGFPQPPMYTQAHQCWEWHPDGTRASYSAMWESPGAQPFPWVSYDEDSYAQRHPPPNDGWQ
jgi:hypothetical protein